MQESALEISGVEHPTLYIQTTKNDDGSFFYGRAYREEEINWRSTPLPNTFYLPVQQAGSMVVGAREAPTGLRLKFGKILMDLETHEVFCGDQRIALSGKPFKLLRLLLRQPGRVFTRDEILNEVWGADVHVFPRAVDTVVSKLRPAIGSVCFVEAVHGEGYKVTLPKGGE